MRQILGRDAAAIVTDGDESVVSFRNDGGFVVDVIVVQMNGVRFNREVAAVLGMTPFGSCKFKLSPYSGVPALPKGGIVRG